MRTTRIPTMIAPAVLCAALAVLLTGCFKIDMDLTVEADDTVDGTMILAIQSSAGELFGMTEDQLRDELEGSVDDLPAGATSEPYDEGDFVGTRVTFAGTPLDEFRGVDEELSIVHEDGKYIVSGAFDLTSDEAIPPEAEPFLSSAEVQLKITFPGEVISSNGEVSDRTVTWNPQLGEVNEIEAEAEDSTDGGGVPGWLWPLLGLAAIGAAALVVLNIRRQPSVDADGEHVAEEPAQEPEYDSLGPVGLAESSGADPAVQGLGDEPTATAMAPIDREPPDATPEPVGGAVEPVDEPRPRTDLDGPGS